MLRNDSLNIFRENKLKVPQQFSGQTEILYNIENDFSKKSHSRPDYFKQQNERKNNIKRLSNKENLPKILINKTSKSISQNIQNLFDLYLSKSLNSTNAHNMSLTKSTIDSQNFTKFLKVNSNSGIEKQISERNKSKSNISLLKIPQIKNNEISSKNFLNFKSYSKNNKVVKDNEKNNKGSDQSTFLKISNVSDINFNITMTNTQISNANEVEEQEKRRSSLFQIKTKILTESEINHNLNFQRDSRKSKTTMSLKNVEMIKTLANSKDNLRNKHNSKFERMNTLLSKISIKEEDLKEENGISFILDEINDAYPEKHKLQFLKINRDTEYKINKYNCNEANSSNLKYNDTKIITQSFSVFPEDLENEGIFLDKPNLNFKKRFIEKISQKLSNSKIENAKNNIKNTMHSKSRDFIKSIIKKEANNKFNKLKIQDINSFDLAEDMFTSCDLNSFEFDFNKNLIVFDQNIMSEYILDNYFNIFKNFVKSIYLENFFEQPISINPCNSTPQNNFKQDNKWDHTQCTISNLICIKSPISYKVNKRHLYQEKRRENKKYLNEFKKRDFFPNFETDFIVPLTENCSIKDSPKKTIRKVSSRLNPFKNVKDTRYGDNYILKNRRYFKLNKPRTSSIMKKDILGLSNKIIFNHKNKKCVRKVLEREYTEYKTQIIKSILIKNLKNEIEEAQFYIVKDSNFFKFKEIVERYDIPLESKDSKGNSFLNLATQANSMEIIDYLLRKNADINTQNNDLNTPLHFALSNKNFNLANKFLNRRADENILNKDGLSPWQCIDNPICI